MLLRKKIMNKIIHLTEMERRSFFQVNCHRSLLILPKKSFTQAETTMINH